MYIGQQYATQHIPKFYASFILLNVFPQRKKMYSYLFLGDLGLLSMPHTLLSDLEKIYIYNILFPFYKKGPT